MPKKKQSKKVTTSGSFIIFSVIVFLAIFAAFAAKKQYRARNMTPSPTPTPTYTLAEVAKHNTGDNCWMAIGGNVYDVSKFTDKHPKGTKYLQGCGNESTTLYNKIKKHEPLVDLLNSFKIGVLASN